MTYTVDDFIRETHQEIIANLTPEERRAILQEMPPEEHLRGLDPDALRSLDPEGREMLRQVLGKLK